MLKKSCGNVYSTSERNYKTFLWKWKLCDFAFEKRLVGHILNRIIVIWFFNPHHFLKMSKFLAGHVTKMWFLKLWITSFWTQAGFALKLQGGCWKNDVVTFTAHLSVTIKRLTRYKQKVVLAAMLDLPSNMAKNQSAIKYLP